MAFFAVVVVLPAIVSVVAVVFVLPIVAGVVAVVVAIPGVVAVFFSSSSICYYFPFI